MIINEINTEKTSFTPIYRQIEEYLRKKISTGEIPPLSKIPTERNLAKEFGVSVPTLRKSLDRLCQQGLLVRQVGKGTFIKNIEERNLVDKKTIGLITWTAVTHISESLVTLLILRGVRKLLGNSYNLQLLYHEYGTKYLDIYNSNNLDGMLIIGPQITHREGLANLKKVGCEFMILSGIFKETDLDFIGVNFIDVMNSAIKYLVELGHSRIGYISGDPFVTSHIEKIKGYKMALKSNGLKFREELFVSLVKGKTGYQGTTELINLKEKPTAIICCDHIIAIDAVNAIRDRGLRIPESISLMAFSDPELLERIEPPITFIRTHFEKIGMMGAEELIKKLDRSTRKPSQILLDTKIEERKSCASPGK